MTKLISGRVKKTPSANVSASRYDFIKLSETEPDLGLPSANGYVLSANVDGRRAWILPSTAIATANVANTVLSISNFTTANLAEGSNLYFTNARSYANLTAASINALADVDTVTLSPGLGFGLIWNGTNWVPNVITVSSTELSNVANTILGIVQSSLVANTAFFAANANIANIALTANVANTVLSISNFTTANLAEGSNLYYTNARVRSNVIALLPTLAGTGINIAANGQISATTSVGSITGLNTANVSESASNLYYTNARVQNYLERIDGNIIPISSGPYDIGSETHAWRDLWLQGTSVKFVNSGSLSAQSNTFTITDARGNVVFTANATNIPITSPDGKLSASLLSGVLNYSTSNVAEGSNLYYTNARVLAGLVGQNLDINDLLVRGDLIVQGNTVTLNTATLIVEDKNLVLANGAINSGAADGAGFTIDGAQANLTYRSTGDKFEFNKSLDVIGTLTAATVYANVWNNLYTANVIESASNLYYTVARANTAIDNRVTKAFIDNLGVSTNTAVFAQTANVANTVTTISNFTTSNLAEGINLYYSNARVKTALIAGNGISYSNITGAISLSNLVVSNTAPSYPYNGQVWVDTNSGIRFEYIDDGNSSQWVEFGSGGGGGSSSTGLSLRTTVTGTTASIAANITANIEITGFKGYALYKIGVTNNAWVRVYTTQAARLADSTRSSGIDPSGNAGVIAEIITTGNQTISLSPAVMGYNDEATPNTNISVAVTNLTTGTTSFTVSLTLVQLES